MKPAPAVVVTWAANKCSKFWPAEAPSCFIKGSRLLVFSGGRLLLDTPLPPHAMLVKDVAAWHAAHQTGRHQANTLPLFADRPDPAAQRDLF